MIRCSSYNNEVEILHRSPAILSTQGAVKRKQHGIRKARPTFRDPSEEDRALGVALRRGRAGLAELRFGSGGAAIMQQAGHKGKPAAAQFAGRCEA